jgi:hypothetical protein
MVQGTKRSNHDCLLVTFTVGKRHHQKQMGILQEVL